MLKFILFFTLAMSANIAFANQVISGRVISVGECTDLGPNVVSGINIHTLKINHEIDNIVIDSTKPKNLDSFSRVLLSGVMYTGRAWLQKRVEVTEIRIIDTEESSSQDICENMRKILIESKIVE